MAGMATDLSVHFVKLAAQPITSNSNQSVLFHATRSWNFKCPSSPGAPLRLRTSSWRKKRNATELKKRSTMVEASATTQGQSTVEVVTEFPADTRLPATILTGFLGSGKVHPPHIELTVSKISDDGLMLFYDGLVPDAYWTSSRHL